VDIEFTLIVVDTARGRTEIVHGGSGGAPEVDASKTRRADSFPRYAPNADDPTPAKKRREGTCSAGPFSKNPALGTSVSDLGRGRTL
jgi:hypothetical protein